MATWCFGKCRRPAFIERFLEIDKVKQAREFLKDNTLLAYTATGVLLGFVLGIIIRSFDPSPTTLRMIGFPGELFIRSLKMIVLPLLISSLVTGTTSLDLKTNGRVAMVSVGYFVLTSFLSAIMGVVLALIVHPGSPSVKENFFDINEQKRRIVRVFDTFMDLFRNAFPENVVQATLHTGFTEYKDYVPIIKVNETEDMMTQYFKQPVFKYREQLNSMGLIVFLMIFGATLTTMGTKGQLLVHYFRVLDKIIMQLAKIVVLLTPVGVISLLCEKVASAEDLSVILSNLGLFILTVLLGLFLHQFVILPLIYFFLFRKNPFKFWWNLFQAFLTGFATDSSFAALPITIQCMEDKNHADPRLTRFVLPIGATINMNGTALFIAIATIFIAQVNALTPTFSQIISIVLTSTAVSIASSAAPSASLILMDMTLSIMPRIPTSDVYLLFVIDWLLGRCRTTNNLVGDCYAVAVIGKFCKKDLEKMNQGLTDIKDPSRSYARSPVQTVVSEEATCSSFNKDQ